MLYSHGLHWFTQILVILHPKTSIGIQMPLQLYIIALTKKKKKKTMWWKDKEGCICKMGWSMHSVDFDTFFQQRNANEGMQ